MAIILSVIINYNVLATIEFVVVVNHESMVVQKRLIHDCCISRSLSLNIAQYFLVNFQTAYK